VEEQSSERLLAERALEQGPQLDSGSVPVLLLVFLFVLRAGGMRPAYRGNRLARFAPNTKKAAGPVGRCGQEKRLPEAQAAALRRFMM